ncbi:hypothetical protein ACF1FX_26335 [Streptomyces sp. NPDC014646]|uniref:hypothetical protein n=1 Tax=unclassified Streptomyces TaxID=2593676 RepID=UPI0036FB98F4
MSVLSLLGLLPPAVILTPQIDEVAAVAVPVSRPDLTAHETAPRSSRCSDRSGL